MSFTFPAYRDLKLYLGRMDAMVEVTELAATSFVSNAETSGDVNAYVNAESEKHKIVVNLSELDSFKSHLAQTYVVIVYQSMERFFYHFRKQHQELYQTKWNSEDPNFATASANIRCNDVNERIGKDLTLSLIHI